VKSGSNATNVVDSSTPATLTSAAKSGSLTVTLSISFGICLALALAFNLLAWNASQRAVLGTDNGEFSIDNNQWMRFADLFGFVGIFLTVPMGLLFVLLVYSIASKAATFPSPRLDSLGKAFWMILAASCVPIVIMSYDILAMRDGASVPALHNRMWLYLLSGIFLVLLSFVSFARLERRRILSVLALSKETAVE
jgi:hypothetical protein